MSDKQVQHPAHEDGPQTAKPSLPPELIEKLRRTGIRLDRQGRFWHEGGQVEHPGLARALLRWLDRLPDGRPILRLDSRRYAYLEVEDAHLLVLSVRWYGDRALLTLNDGAEEELDPSTLRVAGDDALYCQVRGGRLQARLTTPAYYALAERIEALEGDDEDDGSEATFALRAGGRLFPIRPL